MAKKPVAMGLIGNTIGCLAGAVVGKLIRKKKKKSTPEVV